VRATRLRNTTKSFWNLWKADAVDLVTRLTLVYLMWHDSGGTPSLRYAIVGLAGVGLVAGWHRNALFWSGLFVLQLLRLSMVWWLAANHSFLAAWWTLGLATVMADREPTVAIRVLARRIVGLTFACALLWKVVLSDSFTDSAFLMSGLLIDARFDTLTALFGVDAPLHAINRAVFDVAATTGMPGQIVPMVVPTSLSWLARLGTVWTLFVELAVAVTMLTRVESRVRHACLISFCFGTYLVLPVVGFAWLLLLMGLAHTGPNDRRLRGMYVATALVLGLRALIPVV
jgi:hypothetical protein